MAKARWARYRADGTIRPEPEPKMKRWHRFEYAVRDKVTGDVAWRDLVSARQAYKAIGLVLKFYE